MSKEKENLDWRQEKEVREWNHDWAKEYERMKEHADEWDPELDHLLIRTEKTKEDPEKKQKYYALERLHWSKQSIEDRKLIAKAMAEVKKIYDKLEIEPAYSWPFLFLITHPDYRNIDRYHWDWVLPQIIELLVGVTNANEHV